jgi:hypothetical protein
MTQRHKVGGCKTIDYRVFTDWQFFQQMKNKF